VGLAMALGQGVRNHHNRCKMTGIRLKTQARETRILLLCGFVGDNVRIRGFQARRLTGNDPESVPKGQPRQSPVMFAL